MYWDILFNKTPQPEVTLTRADLTWEAFDQSCPSRSPRRESEPLDVSYICTRAIKHDMPHVAEGGGSRGKQGTIVGVWDDDRSTDDSVETEPSSTGLS